MRPAPHRSRPSRRRGLTLVEMLVVVALVVLLMTILVSIFAAATGAITVSRSLQELDQELRQLDGTFRRDLAGITADLTPGFTGLDPKDNLGYFEYGENAFADLQGEDTDDYLAFTAQAPPGQPFTGRLMVLVYNPNLNNNTTNTPLAYQSVPITSEYAEIIYFLRGGNLYRRVLLIAPERAGSLLSPVNFGNGVFGFVYNGAIVGWQGVNDISARPAPWTAGGSIIPIPNTLGDLTNRENRYGRMRFSDDYTGNANGGPDGYTDDTNGDGIPDYYPTLYPGVFNPITYNGGPLVPNPAAYSVGPNTDVMPFPFLFPHSYSANGIDPTASILGLGLLHSVDASNQTHNHAPLEFGDSLPVPTPPQSGPYQSWWGFPTWKETISPYWQDPYWQLNTNGGIQSPGLTLNGNTVYLPVPLRIRIDSPGSGNPTFQIMPFADGAGSSPYPPTNGASGYDLFHDANGNVLDPDTFWEDDLILTGVRSFDVKVYDPNPLIYNPGTYNPQTNTATFTNPGAGYFDLGYEGAYFPYPAYNGPTSMSQTPTAMLATLGHEGRIPPLVSDFRPDPHWPLLLPNVGDNQTSILRLRRVYDTWSTEYSRAPDVPLNPLLGPPYAQPAYPSYPPPYPVPLRGIQIQIRVTDPSNERIRVLTIRQDFSDKQ
jgi:prepilin-type N-terminal cleavage/methylation domain-containing protein